MSDEEKFYEKFPKEPDDVIEGLKPDTVKDPLTSLDVPVPQGVKDLLGEDEPQKDASSDSVRSNWPDLVPSSRFKRYVREEKEDDEE